MTSLLTNVDQALTCSTQTIHAPLALPTGNWDLLQIVGTRRPDHRAKNLGPFPVELPPDINSLPAQTPTSSFYKHFLFWIDSKTTPETLPKPWCLLRVPYFPPRGPKLLLLGRMPHATPECSRNHTWNLMCIFLKINLRTWLRIIPKHWGNPQKHVLVNT